MKSKSYTPPPMAVYRTGKKKETATMAIRYLKRLEDLEGHPDIEKAISVLTGYRKSLDEI